LEGHCDLLEAVEACQSEGGMLKGGRCGWVCNRAVNLCVGGVRGVREVRGVLEFYR
jgi:hypothetical protein